MLPCDWSKQHTVLHNGILLWCLIRLFGASSSQFGPSIYFLHSRATQLSTFSFVLIDVLKEATGDGCPVWLQDASPHCLSLYLMWPWYQQQEGTEFLIVAALKRCYSASWFGNENSNLCLPFSFFFILRGCGTLLFNFQCLLWNKHHCVVYDIWTHWIRLGGSWLCRHSNSGWTAKSASCFWSNLVYGFYWDGSFSCQ
jgi:hypothetical protein